MTDPFLELQVAIVSQEVQMTQPISWQSPRDKVLPQLYPKCSARARHWFSDTPNSCDIGPHWYDPYPFADTNRY